MRSCVVAAHHGHHAQPRRSRDEGELLETPSRLGFVGDVVVPERTEKLENEDPEDWGMEIMLGQSMHGEHDGNASFSNRGR